MATSSQSHPITTSVQYFRTDVQGRPLIPVVSDVYFPGIVNTAQLINHVGGRAPHAPIAEDVRALNIVFTKRINDYTFVGGRVDVDGIRPTRLFMQVFGP